MCPNTNPQIRRRKVFLECLLKMLSTLFLSENLLNFITPFAVHYEKIRNHLRKTATNSAKIHSLARKSEHLRINQIQ